jgi:hypothetical protein
MNIMMSISLGLSIAAILFSLVTVVFSILAYTEVMAQKKSTHKIEWHAVDPEMKTGDAFAKEVSEELLGKKYVTDEDIQGF